METRLGRKPPVNGGGRQLKRSLGLWMATALVIGNMVGSGVFLLPAAMAGEAGPASIFAMLLTGIGAVLLAVVFATLGRAFPRTGGPYAYARRAFGDFVGFETAWGYWIAAWAGNAAIAVAFVAYASVFWGDLASNHLLAAGVAAGLIWVLTGINVLGAREAGWVQVVTTVLKFVPLAAIGVIGLFYIDGGNFTPFHPSGGSDWHIGAAATLALWAFIGLESATVPAGEVKNPERNIYRSTIIGTVVTTIVYVVALIAIMGIIPATQLAQSESPFADAANIMWGGDWGNVIAVVAMISTLGALNGWILLQGRIPLAAAEDGLFPKQFARVHGKRKTPVFGLVVSSVLVTGLMFANYNASLVDVFTQVLLLATLTTLIPYAFTAASELHMFFSDRELFSGVRFARHSVVAVLALAYSSWMIWGAGEEIIAKGFMLLLAGIPIYLYMKWRESEKAPAFPVVTSRLLPPEKVGTPK
jgi:basic amino acid/polyamine antiporter, APA family